MDTLEITLLIIGIISSVLLFVFGIISIIYFKKEAKRKQNEIEVNEKIDSSTDVLSPLFGSEDNILNISSRGSRTSIELKDISKIDEDKIKEAFDDVMFMGNKVVFIIGEKSKEFASILEEKIKSKSSE